MKFIFPALLISAMVAQPALAEGSYSLRRTVASGICNKLNLGYTLEGASLAAITDHYALARRDGVTNWEQFGQEVGIEVMNICPSAALKAYNANNKYTL